MNSKLIPQAGFLAILWLTAVSAPPGAKAGDCWLSLNGSGLQNGEDPGNAYSAVDGRGSKNAQRCWEQTGPGDTMHILEGEYTKKNGGFWRLKISQENDGSDSGEIKKLSGEGRVRIQGSRPVPYRFSRRKAGETWIQMTRGARNVRIENFEVSQVAEGIAAKKGGNQNLEFHNLHFRDTRENFHIDGHPDCLGKKRCRVDEGKRSRNILIQKTSGVRYSKRHVRLSRGVSHVRVIDSQADSEFLDGDFAVGFDVEGPSHDIEFVRCSSSRNLYSLSEYWNGDGFKTEDETRDIRWKECSAFDNADAGFDVKSKNALLENIVALRNNRNIRIWNTEGNVLRNVNASYSHHWGGISSEAGLWTQGHLECHHCTLHNNQVQVQAENAGRPARVSLFDSILSLDHSRQGELTREEEGAQIDFIRTALWHEGVSGINPEYLPNLNNRSYGKSKGYSYGT